MFVKQRLMLDLQSGTCNLREAVIIGSIIEKVSIPALHSRYVFVRAYLIGSFF